jgi:hypothetical protein
VSPGHLSELAERPADEFAVEKEEYGEGLVLGRSRDLALDREVREERRDVPLSQVPRMSPRVESDEATRPVDDAWAVLAASRRRRHRPAALRALGCTCTHGQRAPSAATPALGLPWLRQVSIMVSPAEGSRGWVIARCE